MTPPMIGVSFPADEPERERLRVQFRHPLPAIVPGSQPRPCMRCGLTLAVGPYLRQVLDTDATVRLLCPLCMRAENGADAFTSISLGNPDSKFEEG